MSKRLHSVPEPVPNAVPIILKNVVSILLQQSKNTAENSNRMNKPLFSNHRLKGREGANFCWQVKDSSTSSIAYCLWTQLI
jgi:hypothetical protein